MHCYTDVAVPFILVAASTTASRFIYIAKNQYVHVLRNGKLRRRKIER